MLVPGITRVPGVASNQDGNAKRVYSSGKMTGSVKLITSRFWNNERAAGAYARGLWTANTLADCLQTESQRAPHRVLLVDGDHRVDCQTLLFRATALAHAMLARAPAGSVVSFMLPNWHEAAVIYLAATLAGMTVNPILPSRSEERRVGKECA